MTGNNERQNRHIFHSQHMLKLGEDTCVPNVRFNAAKATGVSTLTLSPILLPTFRVRDRIFPLTRPPGRLCSRVGGSALREAAAGLGQTRGG